MTKTSITTIAVSILALIVAAVGFVSHSTAPVKVGAVPGINPTGGNTYYQVDSYTGGLTIGSRYEQYISLSIGAGQNYASWTNNTGQAVFASGFRGTLVNATSTASTTSPSTPYPPYVNNTLMTSVSTSSSAVLTISSTTIPGYGALVDRWRLAAGTSPDWYYPISNTNTNGTFATSTVIVSGYKATGSLGNNIAQVEVYPGQSLIWTLYDPSDNAGNSGNATSSTRGFNLVGMFGISY